MKLPDIFSKQLDLMDILAELLFREQGILLQSAPDGEDLSQLAQSKRDQFDQLNELDQSRLEIQKSLGFPEDLKGAESASLKFSCRDKWIKVQESARNIFRLNSQNGDLIGARIAANQSILNFFTERRAAPTYGPDGKPILQDAQFNSQA